MKVDDLMSTARDTMTVRRVYAEPVTENGVTVIAAASIWGGGGGGGDGTDQQGQQGEGGGFGLHTRPVGAYVIKDATVTWVPADSPLRGETESGKIANFLLLRILDRVAAAKGRKPRPTLDVRPVMACEPPGWEISVATPGQGHRVRWRATRPAVPSRAEGARWPARTSLAHELRRAGVRALL